MGVRDRKREILNRLDSKTLDARFATEIEHGLNCSPFEAEAAPDVVKEESIYETALTFRHFERLVGKCNSKQITQHV